MATKTWQDFEKDGGLGDLTNEQYQELEDTGKVELPDAPAPEKEKPGEVTPEPEGEKPPEAEPEEPGKAPEKEPEPPAPPVKTEAERLAEAEKKIDEMIKANAGLTEEVIRLRHEKRELKTAQPAEQSELVKKILSLPDGEVLESTTVKEAILADQTKADAAEKARAERVAQVEEYKELAMIKHEDYEPVVRDGFPAFVESLSPKSRELVLKEVAHAENPAELAYTYGLRGMAKVKKEAPAIKPEVKETSKPPEPPPGEAPVILRGGGKGSEISPDDKSIEELVFGNYTAEQLEKMAVEAEKKRNQGG